MEVFLNVTHNKSYGDATIEFPFYTMINFPRIYVFFVANDRVYNRIFGLQPSIIELMNVEESSQPKV